MERLNIDEFVIDARDYEQREYRGVHSGNDLAEIRWQVTTRNQHERTRLKDLLKKSAVTVRDSRHRSFQATLKQLSSSYVEGATERRYSIEVRELDQWPAVSWVTLDGKTFEVMKYSEYSLNPGVVRDLVLKLRPEEVADCIAILGKDGLIAFQRNGVDPGPFLTKVPEACRWSAHDRGSATEHIRQAARFFPSDHEFLDFGFPSWKAFDRLCGIVLRMERSLGSLAEVFEARGLLSKELVGQIVPTDRPVDPVERAAFMRRLQRVDDALDEILKGRG